MTVLGKVIIILQMVVSFKLLVGDHHWDGVQPYPWDRDLPAGGGQPSSCWWVTKNVMVGDPHRDGG